MNRRGFLFWVGLAAAVVLVAFTTSGRRNDTGRQLDPTSTDALGTRALVELVESFGADVRDGRRAPGPESDLALLLADRLTAPQRTELDTWIDDGGVLIVADPSSAYSAPVEFPATIVEDTRTAGRCTLPRLADLELEAGTFLLYDGAGADDSCFGGDDGVYLHVRHQGQGRVVSLGGGVALTNQYLDEADNAVLVARLLLEPDLTLGLGSVGADGESGADRSITITIVYDPILSAGERSLFDLVSTPTRWVGVQLVVAFLVFVWWRARRFGRPVPEPQSVKLPGSLLVRAAGELHRRVGAHEAADQTLRRDHERRVRTRLSLPAELTVDAVVDATAERTGLDSGTVARSLTAPEAGDRVELVELTAAIDAVHHAIDALEAPTSIRGRSDGAREAPTTPTPAQPATREDP